MIPYGGRDGPEKIFTGFEECLLNFKLSLVLLLTSTKHHILAHNAIAIMKKNKQFSQLIRIENV